MKISKLLPGIILPFIFFAFFGSICPDDPEPKICEANKWTFNKVYRLKDKAPYVIEAKTQEAHTNCKADFTIKFGWEENTKYRSDPNKSPMNISYAGLKLELGETAYSHTYSQNVVQTTGNDPNGKSTNVWEIKSSAAAPSSDDAGSTYWFVEIQHDVLEEDYYFWVDVTIDYSTRW